MNSITNLKHNEVHYKLESQWIPLHTGNTINFITNLKHLEFHYKLETQWIQLQTWNTIKSITNSWNTMNSIKKFKHKDWIPLKLKTVKKKAIDEDLEIVKIFWKYKV